jgi:hypothetical protein
VFCSLVGGLAWQLPAEQHCYYLRIMPAHLCCLLLSCISLSSTDGAVGIGGRAAGTHRAQQRLRINVICCLRFSTASRLQVSMAG